MEDKLKDARTLNLLHTPEEVNPLFKEIPDSDESEMDNIHFPAAEQKSWSESFTDAVVKFGGSKTFIIITAIILAIWIFINVKLWTII